MTSNGRVARLSALALATGTLLVAGAGGATAATQTKDVFTSTGGGSVLHLELNLPDAVGGALGTSTLKQDLVLTGSSARTGSFTAPATALTRAVLGSDGNIPVVSAALDKSLTAEYGKANPASVGTFPANPLISGGVLQLTSQAANPDAVGTFAHSLSSVANLKVDPAGASLDAVLAALNAQLTAVLNGVVGTLPTGADAAPVAGVTTTITDLLGQVSTDLQVAAESATTPVQDAIDAVVAQLNALPQALATAISAKTADTSLLSVALVESEQTLSRTAGAVTSTASNKLTGISALGGLITVDGMASEATAALGTGAAAPTAHGTSSILKVNAADLLTVDVTGDLEAALGSDALPAEVVDAVNTALNTVTGALNAALGATLTGPKAGTPVQTADKAAASVSAAHLTIQPVGFTKPLVDLALVPATAEVSRVKAQSVTQTVINPAVEKDLPHTGANLPLTGAIATGLVGMALVVRRRRTVTG